MGRGGVLTVRRGRLRGGINLRCCAVEQVFGHDGLSDRPMGIFLWFRQGRDFSGIGGFILRDRSGLVVLVLDGIDHVAWSHTVLILYVVPLGLQIEPHRLRRVGHGAGAHLWRIVTFAVGSMAVGDNIRARLVTTGIGDYRNAIDSSFDRAVISRGRHRY